MIPRQLPVHRGIAALLVSEPREISRRERCSENWLLVTGVASRLRAALHRIEIENGG